MNIFEHPQLSEEWWQLKVGKISGSRFGQAISKRKNRLVYELMNEILTGHIDIEDFVTDDMQYGLDNEDVALSLYEAQTGIKYKKIGAIISDSNDMHIASPDGISLCHSIVQEVKCTQNGDVHIERIFEGVDSKYMPQCLNYFAVSPEVKEVHFISYCGYRKERPIHVIKLLRESFEKEVVDGIRCINTISREVKSKLEEYRF